MAEMLLYGRPEMLDRNRHAKLRYKPPTDFSFARGVPLVPLMAAEFPVACRTYPIVFVQVPNGALVTYAALSVTQDGNGFIDESGRWTAPYIPAFIRRYPFVLAQVAEKPNDFSVAFDAESKCFSETEGDRLLGEDGKPGKMLESHIEFLKQFHAEGRRTQQLLDLLKAEELLMPFNIDIVREVDKTRYSIRDMLVVDEKKLAKLADDKAIDLFRKGLLGAIYAHLISLQNFAAVANRTGKSTAEIPWWAK
jgi:hypothetical protein